MDPAAAVDHLQQQLAAVQSQLQNLSLQDQVIQNLQNQVQALAAQPLPQAVPVPVAPVAPAASAVPTLKPAKPDTFSNVRSSGRPEAWLFTIETYFEATGINDPHRVTFVATLLRGAAALWWQSHLRSVSDGSIARITTWAAFTASLLEQFAPVGNVRQARDRLRHLLQTKSVAQYTTEFRSLILQIPDASAAEQLDKFIAGLKPVVRREVEMREPNTLPEAMRLADRADQHIYRNTASGVTRPSGPVPMDIGAIDTRGYKAPLARLTPQEREVPKRPQRA